MLVRPRIERLLAGAWERRITLLLAGGGYGKTTALRQLVASRPASWLTLRAADRQLETLSTRIAEAIGAGSHRAAVVAASAIGASDRQALADGQAAVICEGLDAQALELMLILDDADQLRDEDSATPFLRALCLQAPSRLHLVLSGRRLPALALGAARGRGELLEVGAPDLAFTPQETAELLAARLGPEARVLAGECWSLTAGWAAAIQLIADRLERLDRGQWSHALAQLRARRSPPWRDFAEDLIEDESTSARRVLAIASIAPGVDRALLAGVGMDSAGEQLDGLQARGLLVLSGEHGKWSASPVLSEVVVARLPEPDLRDLRARVANWLEHAGRLEEALECTLSGPRSASLALVRRLGHRLIERGYGARVAEVLRELGTGKDLELDTIRGEALVAIGDWDGAMELFRTVQARIGAAPLPPGTAWRFGALLYLRGEIDAAFAVLSATHTDGTGSRDDALVSAWLGAASWARGDIDEAERAATLALRQAEANGDPAARATAHVAITMAAASRGEPERNERHSRLALQAALQAGDAGLLARIHNNRSSKALEDGDYQRAIEEADAALDAGAGHNLYGALAMSNKADALIHRGELDEARALLTQSIDSFSGLGSLLACTPYTLLAQLDAERGDFVRSRMSFERAQRMARDAADAHSLAQALSGLAWVLARDDPESARGHANEAVARASVLERPEALSASAWVALCAGDRNVAAELAGQAEALARRTGDRASLARALEVRGAALEPPDDRLFDAAAALWREVGAPIAALRCELALAGCRGELGRVDSLRAELSRFGVKPDLGVAEFVLGARREASEITITTLGRFSVVCRGQPIPLAAWQSRKARDLLKLLAARRGRPVTRDAAAELLWPGEAPGRLSNRLSVALSTARKVLDPNRSHHPDYFIASDRQTLSLRIEHVNLDVLRFLDAAQECVALASRGEWHAAERPLREAESLYTGDFLEEDQYEDWSVECREEARSAAQQVARLLARAAVVRGDEEEATRHLRRLLERDPYDADAWTALLGSQLRLRRFGEARRQHAAYARRMLELGISPVPLAQTAETRP